MRYPRAPRRHFRFRECIFCIWLMSSELTNCQDILPREEGLLKRDFGQCAIRSDGVL
jgi:hypothetical protein